MQLTKKILLALIFALNFLLTISYFINSILDTVSPSWFVGDGVFGIVMAWILFGLFFLASISSICWLTSKTDQFWIKIPALLLLPLSIPFLIVDYLIFKKDKKNLKIDSKNTKTASLVILIIVVALNIIAIFLQLGFLIVPLSFSKWYWFLILIPLSILCGTIFLILNYFYPRKSFAWLSVLGIFTNWFYLLLNIVDQKQIYYFFKPKKPIIEETDI